MDMNRPRKAWPSSFGHSKYATSSVLKRAVALGQPIISVKAGTPPVRPKYYSEAYLPVIVNGRPQAVVAAYVDLTEQREHFRNAFLLATLALCLLIGGAVSIPTSRAWQMEALFSDSSARSAPSRMNSSRSLPWSSSGRGSTGSASSRSVRLA